MTTTLRFTSLLLIGLTLSLAACSRTRQQFGTYRGQIVTLPLTTERSAPYPIAAVGLHVVFSENVVIYDRDKNHPLLPAFSGPADFTVALSQDGKHTLPAQDYPSGAWFEITGNLISGGMKAPDSRKPVYIKADKGAAATNMLQIKAPVKMLTSAPATTMPAK